MFQKHGVGGVEQEQLVGAASSSSGVDKSSALRGSGPNAAAGSVARRPGFDIDGRAVEPGDRFDGESEGPKEASEEAPEQSSERGEFVEARRQDPGQTGSLGPEEKLLDERPRGGRENGRQVDRGC